MRTITTRIFLFFMFAIGIFSNVSAQNTYTSLDKYPKWRLGLNMGGTWQTSDIKKNYAGLAAGFNIERILNRREDAPIGFSLGFRYLSGNSTGYDNTKNTAIKYNSALNGTFNPISKYDSIPGYFYNNYFTHLAEGNLELKINFPAMEKRTHFIFHVFGGIGVTKYKTRINALDDSSHVYNFTKLSPNPSISSVKSFYNNGTFETLADGNNSNGTFVLTPSLGLGVGYRFNKHVALVFEHKVSFPFTNTLDGQQYANASNKPLKNDIYHYTAVNLIFTIWGKHRAHYTNTNTNTNTTVNNNNIGTQTDPNVYTSGNNQPRPIVSIYTPNSNPYNTTNSIQQVSGIAQYVSSSANLNITLNGYPVNNFTFNPNNGSFAFTANLNPGSNAVSITGSNSAGQDTKSLTINYGAPQNPNVTNPVINEMPPKVIITYPANNYNTNSSSVNVNATVSNISNSSNIAISTNGYAISNFNFNPYNGSVSFVTPLIQGSNSIIVSAFNNAGNDAQQVFVNYTPQNQTTPVITPTVENKPVVSFNNPSSSPFQSVTNTFNVTAKVTNVNSANQVSVQYNGLPVTNFTFSQYGFVNFTANLNTGSNTVVVTGTNNAGSDTKTATINYQEAGFPPVVTLVNPAMNPTTTTAPTANIVATVTNVADQNNINVLVNNTVSQFTYNTSNHTVTVPANLQIGNNTIKISATTNFGSDSKTQTIERKEVAAAVKPIITILNPTTNPFATSLTSTSVLAQVLHVTTAKSITVINGSNIAVPFIFNATTQQLTFTANLGVGANTYVITASNQAGSDTKSLTINYSAPIINLPKSPTVSIVNPASNPFVTTDAQTNVKASTTNVITQQEVSVSVNGTNFNTFSFNSSTKEIEVPTNLVVGTNTITISVSNQGGSDSKTQIIERILQPKVILPIVTIINPPSSPFQSPTATYPVVAEVLNVNSASDIVVTQGQTSVTFNYNPTTHQVTFTANLSNGSNTYTVKGSNSGGFDSKTVTINYVKRSSESNPTLLEKPVVTFTTPSSNISNVTNPSQNIVATVSNVANAAQVSVQINGIATNNFTYLNGSVSLNANLNLGNNTITITGTNIAGTDTKSITIIYDNPRNTNSTPVIDKPVVTFTTPNSPNSTSNSASQNIVATVTNVSNASQIGVVINGTVTNNFTYSNGTVSFVTNLNIGNNTITVSGTNVAGSDSNSIAITYSKLKDVIANPAVEKPVVTITTPSNAITNTTNPSQNVEATITNISSASQVTVTVNALATTNFTFNNGTVSLNVNLSIGNNVVSITGTNPVGSDTKTISIVYSKLKDTNVNPGAEKPVVTFVTPATPITNTNNASQAIEATITNISSAAQAQVTLNGNPITNYTYNNGTVTFNTALAIGNNTVIVKGTNPVGTDTKTISIVYNKIKDEVVNPNLSPKPIVTITSNNGTTGNASQLVSANISFINSSSQVSITINGSTLTTFSYSNGDVSFNANLNYGSNTVVITATNNSGTDSKTVTIFRKTPPAPIVTITKPTESPMKTNKKNVSVIATIQNISSSNEVNVTSDNGATIPFIYNSGSSSISFEYTLSNTFTTFTVSATTAGGSDSKTVTFKYQEDATPNSNTDLITICHYPDGPNSTPQTIQIPTSEWATHQAHGDSQGPCTGTNKPGNNGGTSTPKLITPKVEVAPKTTTTSPSSQPKVEPKTNTTTTAPNTQPKVETTPKTTPQVTTPKVEPTPKTVKPKTEETEPATGPAPRTIKPQ